MKRIYLTCMMLAAICHLAAANAQMTEKEIHFNHLNSLNGLSNNLVNDIYRDEFDFIWIATQDGLNMYDGKSVKIFRPDECSDIPSNIVTKVCGDRNGHLYIKGRHNLAAFDMRSEKFTTITDVDVTNMEYTGSLHWSTFSKIFRYSPDGRHELVFELDKSSRYSIRDFCFDTSGILYVALSNNTVMKVSEKNAASVLQCSNLVGIDADSKGGVWINSRTEGTTNIRSDGTAVQYKIPDSYPDHENRNNVRRVVQISDDEFIAGSYDGLASINDRTGEICRYFYDSGVEGFSNRAVRNLYFDNGLLFIGTFHAGAHFCSIEKENEFRFIDASRPGKFRISSPVVSSIAEDKRGALWIGSISGGLVIHDPQGTIRPGIKERLENDERLKNIKHIWYDSQEDAMWICLFDKGIQVVNLNKGSISHTPPGFFNPATGRSLTLENITRIAPLDSRYLLANGTEGLFTIDRHSYKIHSFLGDMTTDAKIYDFCIDDNGDLWYSTADKVYKKISVQEGYFKVWSCTEIKGMKAENYVVSFYKDQDGILWLSTNGSGIFRVDPRTDTFENIGIGEGLANGCVNGITEGTARDMLYIANNNGISTYDKSTKAFSNFKKSDGYPLGITNYVYVSRDSTIYACELNGILAIKEDRLECNGEDYSIYVRDIYFDNRRISPSPDGPLYSSTLYQHSIDVPSNVSVLSFGISTSSLNPSLDLAFEYRLTGAEKNFNKARGNVLTYSNLSPGRYVLEIRGTAPVSEGVPPSICFDVHVRPEIWETWWFAMLAMLTLLSIASFLIYVYLRNARLRVMLEMEKCEKEQQKKVSEAKTVFMTNISHEFKTPLTIIQGYMEMLMKSTAVSSAEMANLLGMQHNTERLGNLIDEFIDLNKAQGSDFRLEKIPVKLSALMSDIFTMFKDLAHQRGIALTLDDIHNDAVIEIDYLQMSRAICNLMSNAFKYTKDSIEVSVRDAGEEIEIHVCDNGVGIRPENIGRVFERFWQEKEANSGSGRKGSGIGLSFAKRIVTMHSGRLTVTSEPDIRTDFCITLPVSDKEAVCRTDDRMEHMNMEKPLPVQAGGTGKTVLLIDDNPDMLDMLSRLFQSSGYQVIASTCGADGLRQATRCRPDLIISDVMMPEMSGTELCRILKSSIGTSHIPVILLTALSSDNDIIEGLVQGADDYVRKPFKSEILLARAANVLRNRELQQKIYSRMADFTEPPANTGSPVDKKFMDDAIRIAEEHIADPEFDIMSFANELCMSKSLMYDKFKALTGMTPNRFIMSLRLKKAAQRILEHPEENTSDIAWHFGFNTVSYFIKCFKRQFGETPLVWKKTQSSRQTTGPAT